MSEVGDMFIRVVRFMLAFVLSCLQFVNACETADPAALAVVYLPLLAFWTLELFLDSSPATGNAHSTNHVGLKSTTVCSICGNLVEQMSQNKSRPDFPDAGTCKCRRQTLCWLWSTASCTLQHGITTACCTSACTPCSAFENCSDSLSGPHAFHLLNGPLACCAHCAVSENHSSLLRYVAESTALIASTPAADLALLTIVSATAAAHRERAQYQ